MVSICSRKGCLCQMSRYVILTVVYTGTFLLLGMIPVCLFFPVEGWIRLLAITLCGSILFSFLIKSLLPCLPSAVSKGLGYYLWGMGYWGKPDIENFYCGLDKKSFGYLTHWFLIMFLTMVWRDHMIDLPAPVAKWGRCMMFLLFLYNLCMPFYGILWRSCFEPTPDETSSEESTTLEDSQTFFTRIPPIGYDVFGQWICFYAVIIAIMVLGPGEHFFLPIVLTVVSALLLVLCLLFCVTGTGDGAEEERR